MANRITQSYVETAAAGNSARVTQFSVETLAAGNSARVTQFSVEAVVPLVPSASGFPLFTGMQSWPLLTAPTRQIHKR